MMQKEHARGLADRCDGGTAVGGSDQNDPRALYHTFVAVDSAVCRELRASSMSGDVHSNYPMVLRQALRQAGICKTGKFEPERNKEGVSQMPSHATGVHANRSSGSSC